MTLILLSVFRQTLVYVTCADRPNFTYATCADRQTKFGIYNLCWHTKFYILQCVLTDKILHIATCADRQNFIFCNLCWQTVLNMQLVLTQYCMYATFVDR